MERWASVTFNELFIRYQDWLVEACDNFNNRPWCLLGFNARISEKEFKAYFDREELNDQYKSAFNAESQQAKVPHTFIQAEIQLIHGFHKSMVARHKTRLQVYRDDFAQKRYHIRRALDQAYNHYVMETSVLDNPPAAVQAATPTSSNENTSTSFDGLPDVERA
jgi:hypothetical protein